MQLMTDTDKNETFLCDDTATPMRPVNTKVGMDGNGEYVDEFVKKFMTGAEADANDLEPEVEKTGSDAPLSARLLEENVVTALKQIYDPEIPINIYDLGLIYRVHVDEHGAATVDMTLTTPGCPVAQTFPGQVEQAIRTVDGIASACVSLVWEPPWTKDRMSQAALLELGLL